MSEETYGTTLSLRQGLVFPSPSGLENAVPRLRAMLQEEPLAILVFDSRQRVRMCNRAFERLFHWQEHELLDKELSDLPDSKTQWAEEIELARSILEGKCFHCKRVKTRRDGTPVEIELYALPLVFNQGVAGAFALYFDMTEWKSAEEALRASEQRFRLLFERNLAGVYRTTVQGKILECNEAFVRMFGFTSIEEAKRHTAWELHYDPAERKTCLNRLRQCRALSNVEIRLRRLDGTPIWVLQNSTFLPGEKGIPEIIEGTLIDITERKRAEDALRRLSRRLLHLQDEERRRIARGLHETIAQQLAAVAMHLSLVQRMENVLDPQTRQALHESLALVEECSRETRTFSYLLHPPLLDEIGLLSALRWYVAGFTRRSGISVDLVVPARLGRLSRESETTLFRVVQECLTNVHRHSGSATAAVRLIRRCGEVRLEVQDRGCGFEHSALGRTEGGVDSLGVGIAGMRERIRQLGGRLDIESSSRGTTLRAILPLRASEVKRHDAYFVGGRSRGGKARPARSSPGPTRLGNLRRSGHGP